MAVVQRHRSFFNWLSLNRCLCYFFQNHATKSILRFMGWRACMACERVPVSKYSSSPPTGMPSAKRSGLRRTEAADKYSRQWLRLQLLSLWPELILCLRIFYLFNELGIFNSSGPMPSSGDICPMSTKYLPRKQPLFSIAIRSMGFSLHKLNHLFSI